MEVATHTIETDLGVFDVKITGVHGDGFKGELTAHEPVTVNRIEYELGGSFSWIPSHNEWTNGPDTFRDGTPRRTWTRIDEPYVSMTSGYRGIRRLNGGDPTEGARRKIAKVLGEAIAPLVMVPNARDLALAAEREEAAETMERQARYKREEAERLIKTAEKYEAEAARIRNGADYDLNKRFR